MEADFYGVKGMADEGYRDAAEDAGEVVHKGGGGERGGEGGGGGLGELV